MLDSSNLMIIQSNHLVKDSYLNRPDGADYKRRLKQEICNNLAIYLYEHNLITFTERKIDDPDGLILTGTIRVYKEPEKEEE